MKKELSIREKEFLGHLIDTEEPTLAMTIPKIHILYIEQFLHL